MKPIHDYFYRFPSEPHQAPGRCRVRIYKRANKGHTVLLTELNYNPGEPVAGASARIATDLAARWGGREEMLALIRDTVSLVANDPAATPLRFEVSGEEVDLWLDTAQMGRAVLNLVTNAAQAMRHQGVVRISGQRLGDRYRLRFVDEGPGMPDDVRARCLEPFFTTKTRGTGLGLPIAKRVVDEHGGHFGIASIVGAGTEVTIDLPVGSTVRG